MDKNCAIVQDLIPLYVDGLSSDESKDMVEAHIKECEECKKIFDLAVHPIVENPSEKNENDKKLMVAISRKQKLKNKKVALISILITFMLFLLTLKAYNTYYLGDVSHVKFTITESDKYSSSQINDAKRAVYSVFRKKFKGCKLLSLNYDENWSKQFSYNDKQQGDGRIIFTSNYYVRAWGGDGSLNRNETYEGWNWIVVYNSKTDIWSVVDWGY